MLFKNKMVVGFELNNDYSQLSFCTFDQSMPDTLSLVNGAEEYCIPTALLARRNPKPDKTFDISFSVSRDVKQKADEDNAFLIDNFFELIENDASVMIGEEEFSACAIFSIYIKKCLAFLPAIGRREDIVGISINTALLTSKFMEVIKAGLTELPVFFLDKKECFYQYMLHQPAEIRVHDCLLFELQNKNVNTYRLSFNQLTKPIVGMIEEKNYLIAQRDSEEKDKNFETVIKEISEGRIITSSFLIGEGFSKEWCKESLKELCRKGRVFQGNNLYSKGACYYAKEKVSPSTYSTEYLFLGEEKLKINVGMYVNDRGKDKYLPILHAGTNWYEAKFNQDFMLSFDNTLTLHISPLDKGQEKTTDITLEYFEIRKNHTNRINLSLEMIEKDLIHIEVKDLGFGEIFPAKGTVWKDDIRV